MYDEHHKKTCYLECAEKSSDFVVKFTYFHGTCQCPILHGEFDLLQNISFFPQTVYIC